MTYLTLLLMLCLHVVGTGAKAAEDTENRFYQNTKHGWLWYENFQELE